MSLAADLTNVFSRGSSFGRTNQFDIPCEIHRSRVRYFRGIECPFGHFPACIVELSRSDLQIDRLTRLQLLQQHRGRGFLVGKRNLPGACQLISLLSQLEGFFTLSRLGGSNGLSHQPLDASFSRIGDRIRNRTSRWSRGIESERVVIWRLSSRPNIAGCQLCQLQAGAGQVLFGLTQVSRIESVGGRSRRLEEFECLIVTPSEIHLLAATIRVSW